MEAIGVVLIVAGMFFIFAAPNDHQEGQHVRGRSSAILGALLLLGGMYLATNGLEEPVRDANQQEVRP